MPENLTKYQKYALTFIKDHEWHTFYDLFGEDGYMIKRKEFVTETLFKNGYLEQRINPDYPEKISMYSDYFYLYRLKDGVTDER